MSENRTTRKEWTAEELVAEVRREIKMRRRVYPKWVEAERMRADEAADRISRMEAILALLEKQGDQPELF